MSLAERTYTNAQTYFVAPSSAAASGERLVVKRTDEYYASIVLRQHWPMEQSTFPPREALLRLPDSIAPGWVLLRELWISLEYDDDELWIASDDHFAIYGDGNTPTDAMQDYIASLIDYYQLLSTRIEGDAPTQALFGKLREYLNPVA